MTTNYQPLQTAERVHILDLLRGIALLGILMVNMPLMNAPFLTEMREFSLWTDPINVRAGWLIDFFFTGKFYTLFSMLFGMGFYFFMRKADENARGVLPLFRRRLGWLLLIGILHVVLFWYGDILVFYALFGFVLMLFRKKSNKTLLVWAFCILLIPIGFAALFAWFFSWMLSMPQGAEEMMKALDSNFEGMQTMFDKAMVVYASGSFTEIIAMRMTEYKNVLGGILFFFPNVLAMFLVGMVLARKKVFENLDANRSFFVKLMLFSLPVALVGNWMYATYSAESSFVMIDRNMVLSLIGHGFGGPAMTFVYVAIIAHCFRSGFFPKLTMAIMRTGRMALTNYLMQSVIATTLFFSYGFGLYGKVNIWQGMLLTLAIYSMQVVWSNYWLQHYKYGPMEWFWRTLTYGKKQSMKLQK